MMILVYIFSGIIVGSILGWLISRVMSTSAGRQALDSSLNKYNDLDRMFASHKASADAQIANLSNQLNEKQDQIFLYEEKLKVAAEELRNTSNLLATSDAKFNATNSMLIEKNLEIEQLKKEIASTKDLFDNINNKLATELANNNALNEKLETQKAEMELMMKKFNLEFENIANKILDSKTEKFTELNKNNLSAILEPLGKNIAEFKQKVEDVYIKESKERFSLGEKVKELADLNQKISEDAQNLTKALKGEAKTQGDWGEMILEHILEMSGLRKNHEYFMQEQLLDENGNPLRSDSEDKKMRPDAVIKYPDNRSVIIDSKVSLNSFLRYLEAGDAEIQQTELQNHVKAIKNHIDSLSKKGYDDYNNSLDFVMMFIPSEPAYIAAMQGNSGLWEYAYKRRILLMNPTNMITSLKLIVDLWKREYQNQNAMKIAERGAKMFDKFVGFIANLEDVGVQLDKAKKKYSDAHKQLVSGNDNLLGQAKKLKELGLKTKKDLDSTPELSMIDPDESSELKAALSKQLELEASQEN
jgi:DNA recombination protein RmuC